MEDRDRMLLAIRCNDETGLRLLDVLGLPRKAFLPSRGALQVHLRHRDREVVREFPCSRLLRLGLARMIAGAGSPEDPLFADADGERLTPERIGNLWAGTDAPDLASLWSADIASVYVAGRDAQAVRSALASALGSRPSPRVAEIGCAHGQFLTRLHREILLPRNGSAVGVDRIPGEIQAVPKEDRRPGLGWVVGDACDLPLRDQSLDAVLAIGVVEHFPIPEAFLLEARRCLRPGGVLIATTPNPHGLYARLAHLRRWMQSFRPEGGIAALRDGYQPMVDPREGEKAVVHGHISVFAPGAWRSVFAGAGLELESFRPITLMLPNLLFSRHPLALGFVRRADALMAHLPSLARLSTSLCYVARRR